MEPPTDYANDFDSQATSTSSSASSSRSTSPAGDDEEMMRQYYHSRAGSQERAPSVTSMSAAAGIPPTLTRSSTEPDTPVVGFSMRRHGPPVIGRSIHVTPYIMYQLARVFGFPKRVLVFPRRNEIPGTFAMESRGLFQFDQPSDARAFIDAVAESGRPLGDRAMMEVQFSDDCPDVFTLIVNHAPEQKVFVTKNTNISLVITPVVMQKIGPLFDSAPLQQHRQAPMLQPRPPPCL